VDRLSHSKRAQKGDFPGFPALCTIPQFITQHQVPSPTPPLSLSLSLSLSPLPVTSSSEPVSHQLLSLFSRFVLMLHCFAMLQSQSVNIFSLYISEREVFSPTPVLPPVSHQHTFTAVSLFCINCPYTEKISFALKNRARSL